MIEERAIIVSIQNPHQTLTDSIATLEIERQSACGLCGKTRGCGNSIWGKLFAHQSTAFKAQNPINAKIGDSVIVGINEQALLKSALLLYILPLVTLMLGAILMNELFHHEVANMVGALIGLISGLVLVKRYTATSRYFLEQQPIILRLVKQDIAMKF